MTGVNEKVTCTGIPSLGGADIDKSGRKSSSGTMSIFPPPVNDFMIGASEVGC